MNGTNGKHIAQSKGGMWLLTDGLESHFSTKPFMCPCCGENEIHDELIDKLERVREINGTRIYITCGDRCIVYNKKIGGKDNSFHLAITRGADFRDRKSSLKGTMTIEDAEKLFYSCIMARFFGVGIYNSYPNGFYIHADIVRYTKKRPANKAFWYCINKYTKGGKVKSRSYTAFSDAKLCIAQFNKKIKTLKEV